jgi:hypothetical protein
MRPYARARHERARLRILRLAAALPLALALSGGAQAAESGGEDHDRWVPSLGVFFDFVRQKAEGSLTTSDVLGPPLDPFDTDLDAQFPGNGCLVGFLDPVPPRPGPPFPDHFVYVPTGRRGTTNPTDPLCTSARPNRQKLDIDDASSDTSVAPLVGGSLELMTPSPFNGFLYPRLFVHGDYAAAFAFERNLAGKGRPGQFEPPQGYSPQAIDVEELAVQGQGSRARWQLDRDVWSSGGGLALTTTIFQHTIRIKPSFEWIHFSQDFIGVVHRAVKLKTPSQPQIVTNPGTAQWRSQVVFNDLTAFRLIELTHTDTKDFDGIGPGLEIEVDTARLGPILTSVFALGRAYHLIGNLDQSFSASNQYGESASWTFQPEPWVYRAGVGIRFRWVPERD